MTSTEQLPPKLDGEILDDILEREPNPSKKSASASDEVSEGVKSPHSNMLKRGKQNKKLGDKSKS